MPEPSCGSRHYRPGMSSDIFSDPDAKHWRWLDVMPWYAAADWTQLPASTHADLWSDAVRSLDGDDGWLAWWTTYAPRPNCTLFPYFQDDDDKAAAGPADVRRHALVVAREGLEQTPDDIRVYIRYDADWEAPPEDVEALVRRQVLDAVARARVGLGMPEPPAAPWQRTAPAPP